ncbi:MAG TPA: SDR family NAD(P)-dependent oxidoreductase [Candidatus Acidoferrales bacterium]|nr:SDR family NAD(P)-dependent oxidoreductase [Candidatus Acidoferrales bacterium]
MSSANVTSKPLAGMTALVTGASRGIGLAIARRLAELGARLSLCARDATRLESAAAALRKEGFEALAMIADVTHANEIQSFVDRTHRELGPIDILINNAGIGRFGPAHQMSEADWDAVLDTNLKSVFLVTRAVAPGMIERKRGHIVNISSLAGKNAFANGGIYCASKWGLMGLTACMAEDLRAHNIRVSAVCPGSVATDFSPHTGRDTSKLLQPDDVAHAVATLVTQAPQSFISEIDLRPTLKP